MTSSGNRWSLWGLRYVLPWDLWVHHRRHSLLCCCLHIDCRLVKRKTITFKRCLSRHLFLFDFPYLPFPSLPLPSLPFPYLPLPYLTLPYLTLPFLSFPYLTLPYLTLPYLSFPFPSFPSMCAWAARHDNWWTAAEDCHLQGWVGHGEGFQRPGMYIHK